MSSLLCQTQQKVNYSFPLLGCPFRHWDKEHLQRMLTAHGISKSGSNKILDYVENSHYQLACQKYFEITHGVRCDPNSYTGCSIYLYLSCMLLGLLPGPA